MSRTDDSALTREERALFGPRELKPPGSIAWCYQTVAALKARWKRRALAVEQYDELLAELRAYRVWEAVPPEKPYGSEEALFAAEFGVQPQQMRADLMTRQEAGKRGGRGHKALENVQRFNGGGDRAYKLARLKRDRPDLHARVLAGEMSPHAAAVEAGFRRRTMSVRCDPRCMARAIQEHLTAEQVDEVIALLLSARARAQRTCARSPCQRGEGEHERPGEQTTRSDGGS